MRGSWGVISFDPLIVGLRRPPIDQNISFAGAKERDSRRTDRTSSRRSESVLICIRLGVRKFTDSIPSQRI